MSYLLAMVGVDVRGASEEYFFPCVRYRRRRVQSESAVGRKNIAPTSADGTAGCQPASFIFEASSL
jgi:hypothetical protein